MQKTQPEQRDLVALQEQMTSYPKAMVDNMFIELKRSIDQGFADIRNDIGVHKQKKQGDGILNSVRRFFKITFGEPQPENPTQVVLDEYEASKAQLDTLRQEFNQLKEKEQRVREDHEQLQLSLEAANKELQVHEHNLRKITSDFRAAFEKSKIQEQKYRELEDKAVGLKRNNSGHVKDLERADHRIANLQVQLNKCREIILKNTSDSSNQIDDAAITSKFSGLREQIQRLISKYYSMSQAPPELHQSASYWEIALYKLWEHGFNEDELRRRVRCLVFQCMYHYILSRPHFGLDGLDTDEKMETGLQSFEELLSQTAECPSAEITEWRTAALRCAKMLPPHESSVQRQFALDICYILHPLRIVHAEKAQNDAEHQNIKERLAKISQDAFNLVLMLRSSKDTYAYEFPEEGKPVNIEEAEAVDRERVQRKDDKDENSEDIVAFALSGALVRYPQLNPQERIVLEKAWVVVEG